jgi:transglutaminase-like putative cysteine protease
MSGRIPVPVLSALATILAATSLSAVFSDPGWQGPVFGAAVIAVLAGSLGRALCRRRGALLLGLLLSAAGFVTYVTAVFAASTARLGFLPTSHTAGALRDLISTGRDDVRALVAPAPTHHGLVLFAVAGTYVVAAIVDALASGLGRPSLAGLPLLLLFAFPVGVVHGGVGWLPFVLGASGYVALLLAEGRSAMRAWGRPVVSERAADAASATGATGSTDPNEAARAAGLLGVTGRRIGIAAVGVALVVPVAVPLGATTLISGSGDGNGAGSGSGTTRLAQIVGVAQRLHEDKVVTLMHVRTNVPEYLRISALDSFDGTTFHPASRQTLYPGNITGDLPPADFKGTSRRITTTVTATKSYDDRYLPVPFEPVKVSVTGGWRLATETRTILSDSDSTRKRTWTVTSAVPDPTPAELEQTGAPDAIHGPRRDLLLPQLDRRIPALARAITKTAGPTTYEKAAAVQDYLRKSPFVYNLDGAPTGANALSTFLFDTHTGYCEQFASAMVVLLRELGIPARIAIGFTTGQSDGNGGYTITTADAHAWPEVYFAGEGWVRFEPTPRGDGTASVPPYTFVPDASGGNGPSGAVGPDGSTATGPAPVIPFADRGDPNAEPGVGTNINLSGHHSHTRLLLGVLSAAALVALLLAAPGVIRVGMRRRRLARRDTASAWQEIVDSLVDCGISVAASESPRGLARRLTGRAAEGSIPSAPPAPPAPLAGGAATALWALATREEHRRYAPDGASDGDVDATGWVHEVRHGLLGRLSRSGRLRATAAPVSVWGRLRTRVPALVADVLDAGDRLIAAVARLPRLASRNSS